MRRVVALSVVLAGWAGTLGAPSPVRVAGDRADEVRRPAITVHVDFGQGDFTTQERAGRPVLSTGALLDAMHAAAVLPVDVSVSVERLDWTAAVARAAEIGADQAVIAAATAARGLHTDCRDTSRALTTGVTEWAALEASCARATG